MTRFVKSSNWKSRGQAPHFTVAKKRKAKRLADAWLSKSKPKESTRAVVRKGDGNDGGSHD
jgi:hypothetical protein